MDLMPMTGAQMGALISKLHALPKPVLDRARALANTPD
jgi:hypothetical protein